MNLSRCLQYIYKGIDRFSERTGRLASWLVVLMAVVIGYDVAMRYLFQNGSVALQEIEWHLFALIFLLGAAYTLRHDDHVRVDLIYRSRYMTTRRRALIDMLGCLFFLIPFCLLVINASLPFVENSWSMSETSPDPGGLPVRWLLKAAIPVGFGLLMLQGLSMMIRCGLVLSNSEASAEDIEDHQHQGVDALRHNEQDHLL